ncbi:hypothetical protein, partial [Gulbenkiania mobilis]|uniref:hypothetical protein n=1 Tax=Gulbenkiania mobilis TaxID=397457 RepID=UPI000ACCD0FC
MKANSAIAQSLPIVLASIAEQSGLSLGIGGSVAYTNGKHVQVPALPIECSEDTAMLAYGYLYHEGAHIRYTSIAAIAECKTPLERMILNILEDGRIEQRMGLDFPGARLRLDGLSRLIDGKSGAAVQDDPSIVFINHVLLHVLVAELGRAWVQPHWHANRQVFEEIFGTNLMIKVEALIAGTSKRPTTASLLPTVHAIVDCLEQAKNDEQDSQDDQQQGDGQDGDDQQQGDDQTGDDQQQGDDQTGDDQTGDDQQQGDDQTGDDQQQGDDQTGDD